MNTILFLLLFTLILIIIALLIKIKIKNDNIKYLNESINEMIKSRDFYKLELMKILQFDNQYIKKTINEISENSIISKKQST